MAPPAATGARRRRCVVLEGGTTVGCYVLGAHETHTVVVDPLGHAYSYVRPGGALSRHLTPTALSAHRALVRDAVALRNRFAWLAGAPPYLHVSLLSTGEASGDGAVRYQRRLRSARALWPGGGSFSTAALFDPRAQRFELQSLDGLARVRLHASGLLADVLFLAEAGAERGECEAARDSAFAHYATVRQTVVVARVPRELALPVAILLRAKEAHDRGEPAFEFVLDEERHCVASALPESAAFAARPEFSAVAPQAPAAAARGDRGVPLSEILRVATLPSRRFYRRVVVEVQEDETAIFMPSPGGSDILVHSARDQSVLACRGEFFKWVDASGRVLQQFTMETIPPAAFLTQAGSSATTLLSLCRHTQYLLQAFRGVDQSSTEVPSTDETEERSEDAAMIEEVENEHGRFRAFRDGKVRVAFADRTILQVEQHGDACRFFFPDGSSGATTLAAAPVRQRVYIHRALEFADWAFATLDERMERFRRRQQVQAVTQQELKRISVRFGLNSEAGGSGEAGQQRADMDPQRSGSDAATLSPEVLSEVQSETLRHMAAVDRALSAARALSSDAAA